MIGLTPQQTKLRDYIAGYIHDHGDVAPSRREMATDMGLQSPSNINRILEGLEQRGAIRRTPLKSRAIEIVRETCPNCGFALGGSHLGFADKRVAA